MQDFSWNFWPSSLEQSNLTAYHKESRCKVKGYNQTLLSLSHCFAQNAAFWFSVSCSRTQVRGLDWRKSFSIHGLGHEFPQSFFSQLSVWWADVSDHPSTPGGVTCHCGPKSSSHGCLRGSFQKPSCHSDPRSFCIGWSRGSCLRLSAVWPHHALASCKAPKPW